MTDLSHWLKRNQMLFLLIAIFIIQGHSYLRIPFVSKHLKIVPNSCIKYQNNNFISSICPTLTSSSLKSSANDLTVEQKNVENDVLNIANLLTISRVVAIPFFMLSFILRKKTAGVLIYVISCLTDFLDGYIARKFNMMSSFGAFLDPVADKLMVATALIMLVCQLPTWWFACPVALIMCREIGVSALREWMAEQGTRSTVKVGSLGKIKTVLQMVSTAMLLEACPGNGSFDISLSLGLSRPALFSSGIVLLYIATILTVISGFQYFVAAWPVLIGKPNK
jgi:CDP-diacylglycerol--glycerol-3-phosphate 3-phosphatidyltransferase